MTKHTTDTPAVSHFDDLQLHPKLLNALRKLNFTTPTPIQRQAIPFALQREDVVGIAQTGTGKTLAFGLPILHRLLQKPPHQRLRSLIILPTRELAVQVNEALQKLGKKFGLRSVVLIGGVPIRRQQNELRGNPNIIVATPGRLIDHLKSRGIDLSIVDTLVLDEADRMLDMGFAPQINEVLRTVPTDRQTMLFSATMPAEIAQIARSYMRQPKRIEIARPGSTAKDISQELLILPHENKNDVLTKVLSEVNGTVLIFARTRSRAHRVAHFAQKNGHNAAEIHSDRTQSQRRAALDGFKSGKYRVLVATDIASRGIDVSNIELVLNYDLPDCADDYVHRIGRTGRAGKSGHAISFATPDQGSLVKDIENITGARVPISERSTHQFDARMKASKKSRRPFRSKSRGSTEWDGSSEGESWNFPKKNASRGTARRSGAGRPGKNKGSESRRVSEGDGVALSHGGGINPTDGGKAKHGLHYSNAKYARSSAPRRKKSRSR